VRTTIAVGLILTAVAGTVSWLVWGAGGILGAVMFGLVGLALHMFAASYLRRRLHGSLKQLAMGFGTGMGLRLAGAVAAFVALTVSPAVFAPLPTLIGYAAVTIPLLFTEMQFLK